MEAANTRFLPVSKQDMEARGWDGYDFLLITGDAYVDHPSFGTAIVGRVLEAEGYRVAVLAQPDWKNPQSFTALGRPRLGVMISAGNIDSMVAHYTVAKRRRQEDAYSPANKAGLRPDRAVIVYASCIRRVFGRIPLVIGGLEASLRRFAHYDYWEDKVRRSILCDSQADLLSYGMGETATREIAARLASGTPVGEITDVRGTAFLTRDPGTCCYPRVECASFEQVVSDKRAYAQANMIQYQEHDPIVGRAILQRHGEDLLVVNPPAMPLTTEELDFVAELPYVREPHPMYDSMGGVPSIEEVRFSVAHNRGCFGACNFCSLAFHQGRVISARSHESVVREVAALTKHPGFKGYIHDVGGPTANFRRPSCQKQLKSGLCKNRACLSPTACPNLDADHSDYLALLRKLREIPGIKKVFIRSGIRYDYMMKDKNGEFFSDLVKHHVSGQLKVAPEHCSESVLDYMGKPHIDVYERFREKYESLNRKNGKEQYLVPYLISSHPGSSLADAVRLAEWLNQSGRQPEQVQDFYPTPGTLSTCMYYTGIDPRTMKEVYVPTNPHDKAMQRALMQWKRPEKRALVMEALRTAHREDLIGYGRECLLRPNGPRPGPARAGEGPKGMVGKKSTTDRKGRSTAGKTPAANTTAGRPTSQKKAGWAAAKPKKNARPGQKAGRTRAPK